MSWKADLIIVIIVAVNSVQLSKMMEENESKKERDEDMQELQESSHQLAEQVELLRQQLSDSQAQSSCLEQEILSIRYSLCPLLKLSIRTLILTPRIFQSKLASF